MITTSTVFVTGAGASMPFGFPSGAELVADICDGAGFRLVLNAGYVGRDAHKVFIQQLRESGFYSIDSFLRRRPEFAKIGKIAIAAALLDRERNANLFTPRTNSRSWLRYLAQAMDTEPKEFHKNQVAFVTFNYDRTIEHYLTRAVAARHRLRHGQAWEAVVEFPVHHVHGHLGAYSPAHSFGGHALTAEIIIDAAENVRVVGEEAQQKELAEIESVLFRAQRIVYLGFGYSVENCPFVRADVEPFGVSRHCLGTAMGLSGSARVRAADAIGHHVDLHDCDCFELLDRHMHL